MIRTSSRDTGWRQIDAGLWVKPSPGRHVEITFASANDGSALYEVTAYDDRGRPSEDPFATRCFSAFETARRVGDLLSIGSLEMSGAGRA